jgi:8-oxo-dGTP diphosphatase
VLARAYKALLKVYKRFPRTVRRRIVRVIAPSFTVGAICVIEREHDGAVLLVRQAYRRGWGLPGGLTKRGEDIGDCARREVLEEVGIAIELLGEPAVVVDAKPRRIDVVFRASPADHVDTAEVAPTSAEIDEVRWFSRHELPELQHETVGALVALARLTNERGVQAVTRPAV